MSSLNEEQRGGGKTAGTADLYVILLGDNMGLTIMEYNPHNGANMVYNQQTFGDTVIQLMNDGWLIPF